MVKADGGGRGTAGDWEKGQVARLGIGRKGAGGTVSSASWMPLGTEESSQRMERNGRRDN